MSAEVSSERNRLNLPNVSPLKLHSCDGYLQASYYHYYTLIEQENM
jgi:hypothetical protein